MFLNWTNFERKELEHFLVTENNRLSLVRRLYRDGDSHLRAILTAGVVSDAKYEAM